MMETILTSSLVVFGLISFVFLIRMLEELLYNREVTVRTLLIFVTAVLLMIVSMYFLDQTVEPSERSKRIEQCIEREDCEIRTIHQECFLNKDGSIKSCEKL